MSSMTFVINDDSIGARKPQAQVTISENDDGTLRFDIVQFAAAGAHLGDLRGFFFDIGDESLIGTLSVSDADELTSFEQRSDAVRSLGHGADMRGLLGTGNTVSDPDNNRGYDVGLEIGTGWRGRRGDDVREFHFTLGSPDRALTLDDFANVDFGIRVRSIGEDLNGDGAIDTFRWGTAKIVENTFDPLNVADDAAGTIEQGATASGNLLANDIGPGTKVLTGATYKGVTTDFSGAGPIVIALTDDGGNATGPTVTIFSDGRYTIDATQAGGLTAGQQIDFDITYQARQTVLEIDGSLAGTATSDGHLTGSVLGQGNAPPVVHAPATLAVTEDQPLVVPGFRVEDDGANLTVTLVAEVSTLTLSGTAGLVFFEGDGTADQAMMFTGSLADINAALDGLLYAPTASFSGTDGIVYHFVDDEHLVSGNIAIDIAPDADAPVFTIAEVDPATPHPLTGEFTVNSSVAGTQSSASVATVADGGFVVAWMSQHEGDGFGIYAQRYGANHQPLGGEFRVNTTTVGDQFSPSVAALDGGGFVVAWMSYGQDGFQNYGIYGQRYDAGGAPVGGEFSVSSTPAFDDQFCSVAALDDGGFVAVWQTIDPEGAGSGIYGRRFDAAGNPVGSEFQVAPVATGGQATPSVAALDGGGFVLTWSSPAGVFAQRYDAAGAPAGDEFFLGDHTQPAITGLAGGGFLIAWEADEGGDFNADIEGQLFDSSGNLVGATIRISSSASYQQTSPSLVGLPDGGFIAQWNSYAQDGEFYGVYAQRVDAAGKLVGDEFRVNQTSAGQQHIDPGIPDDKTIAVLASGEMVATWFSGPAIELGVGDVHARVFSFDAPAEDEPVTLPAITAALNDTDGSETLKLVLSGFPEGATFSKGHAEGATWVVDSAVDIAALDDIPLAMAPPENFAGAFMLEVAAVVTDTAALSAGETTDTTSVTQQIEISIRDVDDPPITTDALAPHAGFVGTDSFGFTAPDFLIG